MANFSNTSNHGVPFLQEHALQPGSTESNTPSQAVLAQNAAAFQQNSLLPALNPLQFLHPEDPNAQHVASLLQQLQAVGYPLPPMPPLLPPHVNQTIPTPSNAEPASIIPSANNMGTVNDVTSLDREEGELSERDGTASPGK